jgi:putative membrane protein
MSMANQQDATFVEKLGPANTAEITEGSLALQQSHNLAVSEFGRWMVTDHGALGPALEFLAQKAGLSVPTQPDDAEQAKIDELSKLSGSKFDQTYVTEQVADHQQALALLKEEVSKGEDPGLVSFAKHSIPIVEEHLKEAQILSSDLIPGVHSMGTQAGNANIGSGGSSDYSQSTHTSYCMGAMHQETYGQGAMAMSQDSQTG